MAEPQPKLTPAEWVAKARDVYHRLPEHMARRGRVPAYCSCDYEECEGYAWAYVGDFSPSEEQIPVDLLPAPWGSAEHG